MRICIIGDSHISALKRAWDATQGFGPGVAASWWATTADALPSLILRKGWLHADNVDSRRRFARSSGGRVRFSLADHDAFVIVGLHVIANMNARALRPYSPPTNRQPTANLRVLRRTSPGFAFAERLREATPKPIFVIPNPPPNRGILENPEIMRSFLRDPALRERLQRRYWSALLDASHQIGICVLTPPDEVIDEGFLRPEYSSTLTNRGTRDLRHGNSAYGERLWEILLPALAAALRDSPMTAPQGMPNEQAP